MTLCRSVFYTFTYKTLLIRLATSKTFYTKGYSNIVINLALYNYIVNS